MANRFLNNIRINDEYTLPAADGSADQVITTDGAGQLSFVDQSTISAGNAEHVVIYAKNTHTASIAKGTPVYITGTVGATDTVTIAPADASNSAKMPAVGILDATLAVNDFGYVITGGFMDNITTDPIDGATPSSNDTVYVKAGGGLTLTKPTGASNLIQNIAKVGKVSGGNSGSLIVSSILRTNDVPNLTTGKIWVGTATNTAESGVVHLDESNGRMGIGTTSPQANLHVNSSNTISYLHITNSTSGSSINDGMTIGMNGSNNFVYVREASPLYFATNATERMRIDADGNVGIGTTSPVGKLEVQTVDANRYIRFKAPNGEERFQFYTGGTGNPAAQFMYDADGTTRNVQISAGGTSYFNAGNVGIGTTSPTDELSVAGAVNASSLLATNPSNTSFTEGAGATNGQIYLSPTRGNRSLSITTQQLAAGDDIDGVAFNAFYTNTGASVDLLFRNGGNNNFYIKSTGYVGINTISPTSSLEVNGDIRVKNSGRLYLWKDNNSNYIDYNNWITSTGATQTIQNTGAGGISLKTGASTRLFVDSGGNVGIGTTTPQKKLDVYLGTNSAVASVGGQISAGEYAGLHFGYSEAGNSSYRHSAIVFERDDTGFGDARGNIHILNSPSGSTSADLGDARLTILPSGNVGIGTITPSAKFHTAGSGLFSSTSYINVSVDQTDSAKISMGVTSGSTEGFLNVVNTGTGHITASDPSIKFLTNSSEKMRITSSGNVGIGTTSPNEKLHVEGTSRFNGDMHFDSNTDGLVYRPVESGSAIDRYFLMFDETNNASYPFLTNRTPSGDVVIKTGTASGGGENEHFRIEGGDGTVDAYFTNANVGIGTTSPASPLTIKSNSFSSAQSGFTLEGNTNTNAIVRIAERSTDGARLHMYDGGVEKIAFYTDGTDNHISAGNIGIGTTSPTQKLHVSGNARVTGAYYDSNNSAGTSGQVLSSTATGTDWVSLSEIQGVDGSGTANYVTKWSDADSITDSIIYDNGTFVGIGTTSPEELLHIKNGDAGVTPYDLGTGLNIEGTTSNVGINIISSNTGQGRIYFASPSSNTAGAIEYNHDATLSNGFMKFRTGNSERMRITGAGNVGIGTTSPSTKLDVRKALGTGQINDSNSTMRLVDTSTGLNAGQGAAISLSGVYNNSGNILNGAPYIRAAKENSTSDDYGFGLQFGVRENGSSVPTTEMVIDSSGNVGIGTTSPGQKLTVSGNIYGSGTLYINTVRSATGSDIIVSRDDSSKIVRLGSGDADDKVYIYAGGGAGPKVYVGTNGNVGIGTTSPGARLDIDNGTVTDVRIRGNQTSDARIGAYNFYNTAASEVVAAISADRDGANDAAALAFDTQIAGGGMTERMRITSVGDVGIGTDSPVYPLQITSNSSGQALSLTNNSSNVSKIRFGMNSSPGTAYTQIHGDGRSTGYLQFSTNDTTRLYINSSGNVGIGTTVPDAKLQVVRSAALPNGTNSDSGNWIESAAFRITSGNNGLSAGVSNVSNSRTSWIQSGHRDTQYASSLSDSELLLQPLGGNVGIGTTSPGAKLEVSGTGTLFKVNSATSREFYIDTTNPDQLKKNQNLVLSADPSNSHSNTKIVFKIDNYDKVTILESGNVGIGTTSPENLLHVQQTGLYSGIHSTAGIRVKSDGASGLGNYHGTIALSRGTGSVAISAVQEAADSDVMGMAFFTHPSATGGDASVEQMRIDENGNVGIGTTSPSYKLSVSGGVLGGGKVTYTKSYGSLDTTGNTVAGLDSSFNGASAMFTFTCFGHTGGYQKIVYSCYNTSASWNTKKVIDEGTNDFDVEASANSTTITFTFKSTSGTKSYSPKVVVEAAGQAINSTYA